MLPMVAARRAYAAYGASTGGLTHDGRPMPAWEDLGEAIQQAWLAAANAAAASRPAPACQHAAGTVVVQVDIDPERIRRVVQDMIRGLPPGMEG